MSWKWHPSHHDAPPKAHRLGYLQETIYVFLSDPYRSDNFREEYPHFQYQRGSFSRIPCLTQPIKCRISSIIPSSVCFRTIFLSHFPLRTKLTFFLRVREPAAPGFGRFISFDGWKLLPMIHGSTGNIATNGWGLRWPINHSDKRSAPKLQVCQGRSTPYIGDGHTTSWWPSPTTGKQWEFRP